MGISYKKLWVLLIEKDITRAQMRRDLKIATGTMRKLNKGEEAPCRCFSVYVNI